MLDTLPIHPDTVYTEGAVALALDLPTATLRRARREGRLRYTRQGPRVLILGRWLLDWLDTDAGRRPTTPEGQRRD
jgi:hypothetical protein